MKYIQVQVVYRQGMVKTFLAPQEILMERFMQVVRAYGKHKTVRILPDVDQATADFLVHTGNATLVAIREGSHAEGKE